MSPRAKLESEEDRVKLQIAENFALPGDAATQTFAILGIRGSGKTNTGVVITEELLAQKQQVVIIDPVDVWWGLKSTKGGKARGFSIPVIGGDHADVPLDASAGQVLADFVTDTRASVILSLRHLSMNEQRRFAGDFARRLYERKGQQRSPLMLMVDEADEFVPQRLPHGHEAMFGAFDRLVRRGRSSGIGVTLISQRAQVVNKDVLSQVETLIGMRVLHKLDRKALEAWIEAHDTEGRQEEFLASLASLGRGDAWIWSPSWLNVFERVHVRERFTFDSSATPKAGATIAPPKALAPVDLEKLRDQMAGQIEKAKADDPRALRAEIARLQLELKKGKPAPAAPAPAVKTQRVEVPVLKDGQLKRLETVVAKLETLGGSALAAAKDIADALTRMKAAAPAPIAQPHRPAMPAARPQLERQQPAPRDPSPNNRNGGSLRAMERAMLTALAQHPDGLTKAQIRLHAGYADSGPVSQAFAELARQGWTDSTGNMVRITDAGRKALGAYEDLPTGTALRDYLLTSDKLSGVERKLLAVLAEAGGATLRKSEIRQGAGYADSGPVSQAFARLVRYGYAVPVGPGALRIASELQ